ncbi:MAG: M28 family peptidase [Gemmatimonadaceae bacterium]
MCTLIRATFLLAASALLTAIPAPGQTLSAVPSAVDPVRVMVGRLDLERYKAILRGLQQFGDRRQGTSRNRAAVDWIEAQLKSYGCANTERLTYDFPGRQIQNDSTRRVDSMARAAQGLAPLPSQKPVPVAQSRDSAGVRYDRAGNIVKGNTAPTGVNMNPLLQPDTALRRIDAEPDTPGQRQEVYCTKIGKTHPDEMYIVGAHMDGHGFGAALNDDGSGTALVMELARVFSAPDVSTDRSVRFILWNNEETGLNGARAYVAQRQALQGVESPGGSGKPPEPRLLGMIQHDMMMWDHGMPGPDGKLNFEQRREADVNIEFAGASKFADAAQKMAWFFRRSNDKYATDYPAAVGDRMSNTDSDPFKDVVAAISLRENERLAQTGTGWNPTWHQPIDVYSTFSDKDFRLGLNAAQTTLSAVALLVGATLR